MKKRFVAGILMLVFMTGCSGSGEDKAPARVAAVRVEADGYTQSLSYTGYAQADETKNFSFPLSGKIAEVYVEKGDKVTEGQLLAKLDVEAIQLAINNANENIRMAQNNITQLNNNISAQQLTLEKSRIAIDAEKINLKKIEDSYNSEIDSIQLSYDDIKSDFDRAQELYDSNYISQTDYEDAKYAFDSVEEKLKTARENMENDVNLENKKIETMENDYKLQETAVENSKAQLDGAEISLSQAKIALEQSNKNMNDASLCSTVDGYVTEVVMKAGEVTSAGTPVVCVKSGEQVIDIGVGSGDYDKISAGDKAHIIYNDKTYDGSVTNIALYPDDKTRTYQVEITPVDCDIAMGTLVNVEIPIGEAKGCFIPISSVFNSEDVDYIYALEEDGYGHYRTVRTEVRLGEVNGDRILAENLTEGLLIISEGVSDVSDNQQVDINEV